MPRTVNATLATSFQQPTGKEIVWFVELLEAATSTAGSLSRVVYGKVFDVKASGLSDLSDFTTDGSHTWQLSGGRIQLDPGACSCTCLDCCPLASAVYDTGGDITGLVIQVDAERNVGTSGFPQLSTTRTTGDFRITESGDTRVTEAADPRITETGGGSYGGMGDVCLEKYVNRIGTTFPGGPYNEDSWLTTPRVGLQNDRSGSAQHTILDQDFAFHADHPMILSYGADGQLKGWVFPGVGLLNPGIAFDIPPIASKMVIGARWCNTCCYCDDGTGLPSPAICPDDKYSGTVYFDRLSGYTSRFVQFIGLPAGFTSRMRGGESVDFGGQKGGTAAGAAGLSRIDPDGEAYPYDEVEVSDPLDSGTIVTLTLTDDVWGGDVYQWSPPARVKFMNLCSHDLTIDADMGDGGGSRTWTGLGIDGLVVDPIGETGDLRAQRVGIEMDAVNLGLALNTLKAKYRGAQVKVWQAHHDGTDVIGTPLLVFEGQIDEGLIAEERYTDQGRPQNATVSVQATSPLAEFDQNPGIRTNVPAHQRWFPADTGMSTVATIQGKRVFWGSGLPSAPEDAGS